MDVCRERHGRGISGSQAAFKWGIVGSFNESVEIFLRYRSSLRVGAMEHGEE